MFFRFKGKDQSPNVGGIGLGFKEKTSSPMRGFVASSSGNLATASTGVGPSKGPATDRLAAMKEAFKAQYMCQVINTHFEFMHNVII